MIINNDKIKQNIGTIIDEATIIELVDKAKNFKQSIIDEEIKKLKLPLQLLPYQIMTLSIK